MPYRTQQTLEMKLYRLRKENDELLTSNRNLLQSLTKARKHRVTIRLNLRGFEAAAFVVEGVLLGVFITAMTFALVCF